MDKDTNFEFYNLWKKWKASKQFAVFTLQWLDNAFAFDNALRVIILNFEFRFYFKKEVL